MSITAVIVDDEALARRELRYLLERVGGVEIVAEASNGIEAVQTIRSHTPDAVFMDVQMPGLDGFAVLKKLMENGRRMPEVVFATALDQYAVRAFEVNAIDYLLKPFAVVELLARVHALGRRAPVQQLQTSLRIADLEVDLVKRTVTRRGGRIELQPREFQLLHYLLRHAGKVVTRTMLLENVWDFHFDPKTNIVDTHISRLRGKLAQHGDPELIQTVRGAGYCLREPE